MTKLVGVKRIMIKSGNGYGYEYYFSDDFSEYDKEHAQCFGNRVFSEYSSNAFDVKVGQDVEIVYGKGFQGKAMLMNIIAISDNNVKVNK